MAPSLLLADSSASLRALVISVAVVLVACQEAPPTPTPIPAPEAEPARAEPKQTEPAPTAPALPESPPAVPDTPVEPPPAESPPAEPSPEERLASFNAALQGKDYATAAKLLKDGKIAANLLQQNEKVFAELEKEAKTRERKRAWDDAITIRLVLRGVGGPPQTGFITELEKKRDIEAAEQAIKAATKDERWFDAIENLRKLEGLTGKPKDREIKRALERLLKPSTSVTVNYGVQAYFSSVNWRARQWSFDRNSYSRYHRQAERGYDYVATDFAIESDSKSPRLPRLVVFRLIGREFHPLSRFETRFYRWSSYGSFLGNYNDTSNDFAYADSVRFTAGAEVASHALSNELCLVRKYERFSNPPFSYEDECGSVGVESVDEFVQKYKVVSVR